MSTEKKMRGLLAAEPLPLCHLWMLTCDDRLLRRARRMRSKLNVQVENPVVWLREQNDEFDA